MHPTQAVAVFPTIAPTGHSPLLRVKGARFVALAAAVGSALCRADLREEGLTPGAGWGAENERYEAWAQRMDHVVAMAGRPHAAGSQHWIVFILLR